MFQPDEITMDGFRQAGCDLHLYNRMMDVVRSCEDPVEKIHLLNDYYERIARKHVSSILNMELRSSHALHQVCTHSSLQIKYIEKCKYTASQVVTMISLQIKYIEQCKYTVCADLRKLVRTKLPSYYNHFEESTGRLLDEALENRYSAGYWHLHAESTFLASSFVLEQLLVEHNEQFFYLTPQNLHISNSVWVSCIMFRLGQHDDFTYIGMPVVIVDAAGKLRMNGSPSFGGQSSEMKEGMAMLIKIPSAGLDTVREQTDSKRTSFQFYMKGHVSTDDGQKLIQLKRFTEGGLQVHFPFVVFQMNVVCS